MLDTQLNIILPHDQRKYRGNGSPKTLILLHGLSDNASAWYRRTAIERYAENYSLTVVMPEVQRSYYSDMVYGQKAYTYISEELPAIIESMFKTSLRREDLMIAGLSMGGYGALRCAFGNPNRFGYCGAFSGAYDILDLKELSIDIDVAEGFEKDVKAIFGLEVTIPDEATIPYILEQAANSDVLPELYLTCGTEDFLYPVNLKIKELCTKLCIRSTYEEWNGAHEWSLWDKSIEKMLKLFMKDEDYTDLEVK